MSAGASNCRELRIFLVFGQDDLSSRAAGCSLSGHNCTSLAIRAVVLEILETWTLYTYHVCAVHLWCGAVAGEKLDDLK